MLASWHIETKKQTKLVKFIYVNWYFKVFLKLLCMDIAVLMKHFSATPSKLCMIVVIFSYLFSVGWFAFITRGREPL